jgi:hypothetical protein
MIDLLILLFKYILILAMVIGFITFNAAWGTRVYPRIEEYFFRQILPARLGVRLFRNTSGRNTVWSIEHEDREQAGRGKQGLLSAANLLFPLIATLPIWVVLAAMIGIVWLISQII